MTPRRYASVTKAVGRCGELLTMYQLERFGAQCALVDRDENDLWVRTATGRMLMVQVKTATQPRRYGNDAQDWYNFHVGNLGESTDLYALVALQPEIVVFCQPEWMRKRFPVSLFTRDRMMASMEEHFR